MAITYRQFYPLIFLAVAATAFLPHTAAQGQEKPAPIPQLKPYASPIAVSTYGAEQLQRKTPGTATPNLDVFSTYTEQSSRQMPHRNFEPYQYAATEKGKQLGEITEQSPLLAPHRQEFNKNTTLPAPQNTPLPKTQLSIPKTALPQATPTYVTIDNYPLSEPLLTRLEKIHTEILQLPQLNDTDDAGENSIRGGIAVLVKALERRPDIMGILGRNLMNAADYVTAMQACANALAASGATEDGDDAEENSMIKPENLAFGKKYGDRIRNLLEE